MKSPTLAGTMGSYSQYLCIARPSLFSSRSADFTYENAQDYFKYLDGIIDALNADPQGRFDAFYSSPAQYVAARIKNVAKMPTLVGDLFPYNDGEGKVGERERVLYSDVFPCQ